jgi:tyrosinase
VGVNLPTKQQVGAVVAVTTYDASPWDDSVQLSFRNRLEGWQPSPPTLHNLVHVWVGGDMGLSTSPSDPVFFLNHANVDRIWAAWQARNPSSRYLPAQNTSGAPNGHRERDPLVSIVQPAPTPADLVNVSAIYSYDTLADI